MPWTFSRLHLRVGDFQIFGPVMQIMKFKGLDEFIDRAHNTIYGLAASVFTRDLEKAIYLSNSLRAGTVWWAAADHSAPGRGFM